ncbi:MAG: hypothetical protein ABIN97_21240, partial [Ginsengibacter sp.]
AYSSSGTDPGTSPIAEISDKNNLGVVQASIYENNGAVRKYNNQPYLDRNLTIRTDNFPSGAKLDMLIYFSKKDFDALKAADHSILTPDYLTVIRQPNTTTYAPDTYTPVAGEELLTPIVWDSVPGGYFVKVIASGVGNFFLQKISTITLCAGSSTTLTSDVTGATYQWQVNTGTANFYDIANNANYAGTTTRTLSLNNLPSSFNGYRYRCVVNNTNVSRAFTLSFLATWTGAVSNAWENPGNWGCGIVPDSNTDVIINTGTVTINSNVVCRSLTVNPGVIFTINPGFKLTITH